MRTISEHFTLKFTLIMLISVFVIASCTNAEKPKMRTGGPYYFEGLAMKVGFPIKPIKETKKEEAQKLRAYYVIYYDNKGRFSSCSKMLDGKVNGSSKYHYSDTYLDKEEYTDQDGITTMYYYDKSHNILKTEKVPFKK
ncbi:MAG: hypothetical protein NTW65_09765 [Deltaproteobacteria bacterium]|nr:hypothetical protein [Deltaproteobacteria bacterium]